MCSSPIPIRGRSLLIRPYYKTEYYVPCGVCGECMKQRRKDLLPRLEREFHDAAWSSIVLLTYTENEVRDIIVHTSAVDRKKYNISDVLVRIPAFRQSDFKNFFDVFRRKLYAEFPQYKETGIKFFCASEYGRNPNGTMRGHFHLVTHYSQNLSWSDKIKVVRLQCGLWSHGATSIDLPNFSGYHKLIVQNAVAASRYVSKYVSKQIDEVDKRFRIYRDWIDRFYRNKSWYLHTRMQKMFREVKPKVWYSRGYGLSLLPDLTGLDDSKKYDVLSRGILKVDASGYNRFSRYFIDKCIYDFDYVYYGTCTDKEKMHLRKLTKFGAYYKYKKFAYALQNGYRNLRAVYPTLKRCEALKLTFARLAGRYLFLPPALFPVFENFAKCVDPKKLHAKMCNLYRVNLNLISKYAQRIAIRHDSSYRLAFRSFDFIQASGLLPQWKKVEDMQLLYAVGSSQSFNDSSDVFRRVKDVFSSS